MQGVSTPSNYLSSTRGTEVTTLGKEANVEHDKTLHPKHCIIKKPKPESSPLRIQISNNHILPKKRYHNYQYQTPNYWVHGTLTTPTYTDTPKSPLSR